MEELRQLIKELKENIRPDVAEKLLSGFSSMPAEMQERLMAGLRMAAEQKRAIQDNSAKRKKTVAEGLEKMKSIEKNYMKKQKEALKQLEQRTKGSEADQANTFLNQL